MTPTSPRAPWTSACLGLASVLLLVSVGLADVLILTDGTRLEGTVQRSADGYTVIAADGTVTNVLTSQVAGFHLKGDAAGGTAADSRLQSLRRSVSNLEDLDLIISKYESFLNQNTGTPAAEQAQADLERWRDIRDRGLVKHGVDWVLPAERDRRLRDAFLEVSDARLQIKNGDLERARRRANDPAHSGGPAAVSDVATMLSQRDELDRTRAASPLYAAEDAIVVDTTERSIQDVVAHVMRIIEAKRG